MGGLPHIISLLHTIGLGLPHIILHYVAVAIELFIITAAAGSNY